MSHELHCGLLTPRTLPAPLLKGQNLALVTVSVAASGCQRPWILGLRELEYNLDRRGELDDPNVSLCISSKTDTWRRSPPNANAHQGHLYDFILKALGPRLCFLPGHGNGRIALLKK